ncbi:MAG TPA: hypothetical protein VL098_12720 [Flavipsychrobacter sp.]|nr:hypothetical protein [Flavipsychrobacter sp.]
MMDIARPQSANSYQATGVAQDQQGNQQYTYNPINNFVANQEIRLTFLNTGGSNATRQNIDIFPKITNGSAATLPTGLTVPNTFGAWADWLRFINREDFQVSEIRIQTDDTSHFTGDLVMGETRFDGVDVPEKVNMTKYRVSTGNGYSDVITIKDKPFTNKARFFMQLSQILTDKQVTIYMKIAGCSAVPMVQPK